MVTLNYHHLGVGWEHELKHYSPLWKCFPWKEPLHPARAWFWWSAEIINPEYHSLISNSSWVSNGFAKHLQSVGLRGFVDFRALSRSSPLSILRVSKMQRKHHEGSVSPLCYFGFGGTQSGNFWNLFESSEYLLFGMRLESLEGLGIRQWKCELLDALLAESFCRQNDQFT